MVDKDKVIKALTICTQPGSRGCFYETGECPYESGGCRIQMETDALQLIKEMDSTLGMKCTVDGITFTSTGEAKQGEERGSVLGKAYMKDQIEKALLYNGLLTKEIREIINSIPIN